MERQQFHEVGFENFGVCPLNFLISGRGTESFERENVDIVMLVLSGGRPWDQS